MRAPLPESAPVAVAVFDLDDTLYLERDYVRSGFRAVGDWLRVRFGVADFAERASAYFDAGERRAIFDHVFADLRINAGHELVERSLEVYRRHLPDIALAPDTAALLDTERPAGLHLALITDGHLVAQHQKIRALQLNAHCIWPLLCTDIWGRQYWKPHPRAFEFIEAQFNLPPGAFTYIGDNLSKDFVTPRKRGWHTVCLQRPERIHVHDSDPHSHGADMVVADFSALIWTSICPEGCPT